MGTRLYGRHLYYVYAGNEEEMCERDSILRQHLLLHNIKLRDDKHKRPYNQSSINVLKYDVSYDVITPPSAYLASIQNIPFKGNCKRRLMGKLVFISRHIKDYACVIENIQDCTNNIN